MAKAVDWVLRRAAAQDVSDIGALMEGAYQPYVDAGMTLPDMQSGLPDDIAAGRLWVVADTQGLLGALCVSVTPPTAYLLNVAVDPAARGRGVGGALIHHAIGLGQAALCETIVLTTHARMPENIALYQYLGWSQIDRNGDRIRMSKPL